jgi:hypothetical protein
MEYLGLVAYLTVMLGRLPDRELLRAAITEERGAVIPSPERGTAPDAQPQPSTNATAQARNTEAA